MDDIFNFAANARDHFDGRPRVKSLTALVPILPPQPDECFSTFGASILGMPVENNKFGARAALAVLHWPDEDRIEVTARTGGAELKLSMTAAELRDAASAFMSAARALEMAP